MTVPKSRMQTTASVHSAMAMLTTRNRTGWESDFCGAGRAGSCAGLIHAENAVAIRMKLAKEEDEELRELEQQHERGGEGDLNESADPSV